MTTRPNDLAYPIVYGNATFDGLTKRELFAALAMQGCITVTRAESCANYAVAAADALISRLNATT